MIALDVVMWDTKDLNIAEYNPREISPEDFDQLRQSIKKFGLVEPLVVNTHPDRYGVVVGGHQRLKVVDAENQQRVPCMEVSLTMELEKELNLRLNKNTGQFNLKLLLENFEKEMLKEVGFTDEDLDLDEDNFKGKLKDGEGGHFPIVPKFSEKYSYVAIIVDNEVDEAYIKNFFKLNKQKCYKTSRVGVGYAVRFEDFVKSVEAANKGE